MRKKHVQAVWCLLVLGLLLYGCHAVHADPSEQSFPDIERGGYLTTVAACAACHTDPGDKRPFAGGRPIETPFGVVVAANITPDPETGIGNWTDRQFDDALRRGRRPDGSRLYPAMPYPYYTRMTAQDVRAIHSYLRTPTVHAHNATAHSDRSRCEPAPSSQAPSQALRCANRRS